MKSIIMFRKLSIGETNLSPSWEYGGLHSRPSEPEPPDSKTTLCKAHPSSTLPGRVLQAFFSSGRVTRSLSHMKYYLQVRGGQG